MSKCSLHSLALENQRFEIQLTILKESIWFYIDQSGPVFNAIKQQSIFLSPYEQDSRGPRRHNIGRGHCSEHFVLGLLNNRRVVVLQTVHPITSTCTKGNCHQIQWDWAIFRQSNSVDEQIVTIGTACLGAFRKGSAFLAHLATKRTRHC